MSVLEVGQLYLTLASGGFKMPIKGIRSVLSNDNQPVEQNTYYDNDAHEAQNTEHKLLCTNTHSANTIRVMDHCLLTFNYSKDTIVELKFDARHRSDVARLKRQAQALVSSFQVRG